MTFLTLLQSRPAPAPPASLGYYPTPFTQGGAMGGAGSYPFPYEAEVDDDAVDTEPAHPEDRPELLERPTPASGGAKLAGALAAAAAGAIVAEAQHRSARGRTNPDGTPAADLAHLPVAHGRTSGRVCLTCKERKAVSSFESNKRICKACRAEGVQRLYDRTCVVCGTTFESVSSKASLCSEPCKSERRRVLRRPR